MRRDDVRFAVAAREDGLRRVRRLTTRIGAVGVVSSAAIAVALGHPAGAAVHATSGDGNTARSQAGHNGSSPSSASTPGGTVAASSAGSAPPSSPPPSSSQPSASPPTSPSSSPPSHPQPASSPQAPAQNPVPSPGPSQVVSGGS
jgi:hypothetical protein